MSLTTLYQSSRKPGRESKSGGRFEAWRRLLAEDSLVWSSPLRLLLMLAILVLLVTAILVAVAW